MSISVYYDKDRKTAFISLEGRFTFDTHDEFRSAYESLAPGIERCVVNLYNVEYIDSAAVGMLLRMRERMSKRPNKVALELRGANKLNLEIIKLTYLHEFYEVT